MRGRHHVRNAFLLALLAGSALAAPLATPAQAQGAGALLGGERGDPNAQLVLAANEVIYDNDRQIVTARGAVQLEYNGYNVVAQTVTYDRRNRRVIASGAVEIVEPDGNRLYAERIDLSDDFADGFVEALRVETVDDTRFAAESAERLPGDRTVFNQGAYTACRYCPDRPRRPLSWVIKAERIVLDGETRTVEYRNPSFELFGVRVAQVPYYRHPDPTVRRKTGFLFPSFGYKGDLGFYSRVPFFWATSATNDVTFTTTAFSNQGVLEDIEFRQRFDTGLVTARAAGIVQLDRDAFDEEPDRSVTGRGALATTGRFDINPRWSYGWNGLLQSDNTFARTYDLPGYTGVAIDNEVYLRGLDDRSYFDLTAYQFLIQAPPEESRPNLEYFQDEQALVHPVLDYNKVEYTEAFGGGEASLDVNVTSLSRSQLSVVNVCDTVRTSPLNPCLVTDADYIDTRTHGIEGTTSRATFDARYRKQAILSGLDLTTTVSLRGDYIFTDGEASFASPDVQQGSTYHLLPLLGLTARYPVLIDAPGGSHVVEPIAQLLLRPGTDDPTLPNEDAQSLVFDSTRLFTETRFSGYDRLETGTRVNLGLRYSGTFDNGLTLDAVAGQSFHLFGSNPYAREDDLINVGEASGLETDRSDYVLGVGVGDLGAFRFDAQARFDESDLSTERVGLTGTYASPALAASASYTFIAPQPQYGFPETRQEVAAAFNVRLSEYWRAQASATFDLDSGRLVSDSLGLSYADECLTFSISYAEIHDRYDALVESDRSITFRVGFRTLGDFDTTVDPQETDILR